MMIDSPPHLEYIEIIFTPENKCEEFTQQLLHVEQITFFCS